MNTHYKTNKLFSTQLIASDCKSVIFEGKLKKAILGFLFSVLFFFGFNSVAQTYNFTNAGATGRLGPTQAQLDAEYNSTILDGKVTSVGGIQYWVVPASGTYYISAIGASGGNLPAGFDGGLGAKIEGEFYLIGGSTLKIAVGQMGGDLGAGSSATGGGGGTFVTLLDNTPLVIAGGGGGRRATGATQTPLVHGVTGGNGQNSCGGGQGGTNGNGGLSSEPTGLGTGGPGAGLLTNGGPCGTCSATSIGIAFINGAMGGQLNQATGNASEGGFGGGGGGCWCSRGTPGGGGGYSGGGTGMNDGCGGGGGSFNSGVDQNNEGGVNSGHGIVIIKAIAVGSADIEAVAIAPVTNVPFSMCNFSEHEFDITLKNNGPDDASFIDFKVYMEGMDTVSFEFFDILDLLNGQTKTYRVSTKKMNPKKPGNYTLTFEIVKVMSDGDDPLNNTTTANIVVNNLPSGSVLSPSSGFPGFPKEGDKFNPDHITYNKTYRYVMSPPAAFNNNNYSTAWTASFNGLLNGVPLQVSKYSYTPPSGGNNAFVDITLPEGDLNSEVEIIFTIMDLTGTGCDTSTTRFARVFPTPKLGFEGTFVCEGAELQFTNKSSIASGTNTYIWDFGDGNGSVLFEPKHKYQAVSTYPVKLIAISNLGFSDSISLNVEVDPAPQLNFTFQNQCGALPVVFQNNSTVTTGNMTYVWDFGDGSTSDLENPSYIYPVAGPYEVTLIAETDKGCYSELKKSTYSYPTPKVDFLAPITLCAGENIIIQNSTSIEFSTWGSEWTIGNSNTKTLTKNPSYVFTQFGEQPVKLKVTTQYGCVDSISKMITIQPGPAINLTHSDVCSSGPVTFNSNITVPDGMQVDYVWNISGMLYSEPNPVVSFGASGTKNIAVDITYANGCRNNASTQVVTGYRPNASFDVPDVVCSGEPFLISNNTTIEFGNPSNTWIMGDGAVYTDVFVPNHVYANSNPEQYTITLISASSNGQCPDTVSHEANVGIVPSCDFDIIETYVPGHRGYSFVPTQSGANYTWYYGDGRTSTDASPVYQFERDGEFNVRLVVTTDEGCQCETSKLHSVYNLNTDLILAQNGFSIYPNPSNGIVKVGNTGNINVSTISVVNVIGETVYSQSENSTDSEFAIDLSNLANGVYMVRITTADNKVLTQKVIISK